MQKHVTSFKNREEAGRLLGEKLARFARCEDVLVLALPRGGVPVAHEVAKALGATLDVLIVRKLGVPAQEELAMGAISSGGVRVLNESVIRALQIDDATVQRVVRKEQAELERREALYRGRRPPPRIRDRIVIVVDDGVATGSTMRAALELLRGGNPRELVVAAPTAPPDTVEEMKRLADDVVTVITPEPFHGVGNWYDDFTQTSDETVRHILETGDLYS